MALTLEHVPGTYWVSQTQAFGSELADTLRSDSGDLWSVSCSEHEVSIVSTIARHDSFDRVEGPWSAFRVTGTLDFGLTGILSRLSGLLAAADISDFAVSTYNTDYLLVPEVASDDAVSAWTAGDIPVSLSAERS